MVVALLLQSVGEFRSSDVIRLSYGCRIPSLGLPSCPTGCRTGWFFFLVLKLKAEAVTLSTRYEYRLDHMLRVCRCFLHPSFFLLYGISSFLLLLASIVFVKLSNNSKTRIARLFRSGRQSEKKKKTSHE